MTPLTLPQRDVLTIAIQGPLRRVHDPREHGQPRWPANPNTLHSLVRRELLGLSERLSRQRFRIQEWAITEQGREALKPVLIILQDRPIYLAHPGPNSGDYTYNRKRSFDPDVEVFTLKAHWGARARVRHLQAVDRYQAARQLKAAA